MSNLDEGTLGAKRTAQHPDRVKLYVPDDVLVELGVVFGEVEGRRLTLNLPTPKKQPDRPRPAIVFLHGGSWLAGNPSQFHFHDHLRHSRV
jgi:acetyl esterase/lipase